jgi:DNA replication and repair protein RecF
MHLNALALTRFRNFAAQEAAFCPGLNLLSGPNGHGKTNLLEAIHYGCLAHSQRTRKDKELIQWGAPSFVLRLTGEIAGRAHSQSVEYAETGHKRVKVDGRESKRLSDLLGHFSVVSFSPEDLDLIRGGPQLRRRYLDVLLCQFSREYLDALRHYNGALKQRNSLLKQMGGRKAGAGGRETAENGMGGADGPTGGFGMNGEEAGEGSGLAEPRPRYGTDVLEAYDAPLIEHGARINALRRRALSELAPLAAENYRFISDAGEELSMGLSGGVSEAFDEAEWKDAFRRKLASLRAAERETGQTLAGPHREDLAIDLAGRPARDFGSQGQKRSVALSLKLASASLLEAKRGQAPILLLDDVFAELDETRRRRIGDRVREKGQVFIANPRAADLPFEPEKTLHIRQGTLA